VNVRSARDMLQAVQVHVPDQGVFVATAAVADWRPANSADQKIKKDGSGQTPQLSFVENPDILATVAQSAAAQKGALFCVGFAAESHDLLAHATAKRCASKCRCWWATSARPLLGKTTTPCCWWTPKAHASCRTPASRRLAVQLIEDIARR
jgi:phosphopantothenoylcysteine decarboxylase / phosphopantothenate---cysteine ligase